LSIVAKESSNQVFPRKRSQLMNSGDVHNRIVSCEKKLVISKTGGVMGRPETMHPQMNDLHCNPCLFKVESCRIEIATVNYN